MSAILNEHQAAFVGPGDGTEVSLGKTPVTSEHMGELAGPIIPGVPLLCLVKIDRLVGLQRDAGADPPGYLEFRPNCFIHGVHFLPSLGHNERAFMAVKAGQVLFRLDRVKTEAAYASAVARYDNAKSTLGRLEPLLSKHAVAQQDVDNARAELDAAKAAMDQAKKDLDDSVVRAEASGRVGRAMFQVGGRVTGPADLLTTIDELDPAYVVFRPSSQQVLDWKADPRSAPLLEPGGKLEVHVVLANGATLPRVGRLTFVAPSLDSTTGTQEFRATFENHDRLLLPGQFVNVRLSGFSRVNALAVPQRAVQQGLGRQFVYVVSAGDTVVARDVKTGPWSGPLWIIDDGLKAGDRVIVDGIQKAAPGRVVKPSPVAAADSAVKAPTKAPANTAGAKK